MSLEKLYPAPPQNVPAGLTEPSESFRTQVSKVIFAIIAFVLTYLLMIALSLLLLWVCIKIGLFIMKARMGIYTLLIGAGLMLMGILVVFFLIKFLFASSGGSEEHGIEIKEADEPELFEFIRKIVAEVGTHFPKKIFLIPDVNASVFYSSSFWSLLFPTRKNLNIGLGLINSINLSEFKAVLAHEFGHFSQKSMSLGSYVYYVNQVIFNMLYRNDGWANTANAIASIGDVIYFFVNIAVHIVQGVQSVLRSMYSLINRQYMALSREMEFHADTISASVSGSNNMVQALRQITLGNTTYQETLNKCNELLEAKKAPVNVYIGQLAVAGHIAYIHELPLKNKLPIVTNRFVSQGQNERVNFKDQWASHPTIEEREASLEKLNLDAVVVQEPAWCIFQDPEKWQQKLTDFIYKDVAQEVTDIDNESFMKLMEEDQKEKSFPKIFKGYYDQHVLSTENWLKSKSLPAPKKMSDKEIADLFSENLDSKIMALQQDIETLNAINEQRIDTQSFDFDGKKYEREEAFGVKKLLEKELENLLEQRTRQDEKIISDVYAHAASQSAEKAAKLHALYKRLAEALEKKNAFAEPSHETLGLIQYLAQNNYMLLTEVVQKFRDMQNKHEPEIKRLIMSWPWKDMFSTEIKEKIEDVFEKQQLMYEQDSALHRQNLEKLFDATVAVYNFLHQDLFETQKATLKLHEEIIRAA